MSKKFKIILDNENQTCNIPIMIPHGLITTAARAANTSPGHLRNVLKGIRDAGYNLAVTLAQLTDTDINIWLRGGDKSERETAIEKFKPTTQQG